MRGVRVPKKTTLAAWMKVKGKERVPCTRSPEMGRISWLTRWHQCRSLRLRVNLRSFKTRLK